jgi:quinohemoprotein amine dehydrogenase beta subunit
MRIPALAAGLTALALVAMPPAPAEARDLLVTAARPANLYVFDAAERELVSDCALDVNITPGVIAMSPDGRIAYVLVNRWQDVIGVDIMSCEPVFMARQSEPEIRRRTIASLAVSRDGAHVYTIRNPYRLHPDRYEVMEPEFAVFEADAGLEAEPVMLHPAPRRSTIMASGADGLVYIGGHDIFALDPETGEIDVAIPNASWDRPLHSPPDVLAFWPIGTQNDELLLMYTAALFADESWEEIADYVWGYSAVDLATGETEIADFASLEVLMFSGVRNPQAPSELYGVYTQLSKHDLDRNELIKRVDLPHTYYVINIASDGSEVYVGGTLDDIGIYDTETLERIGEIMIPSGGDMGAATLHVVRID